MQKRIISLIVFYLVVLLYPVSNSLTRNLSVFMFIMTLGLLVFFYKKYRSQLIALYGGFFLAISLFAAQESTKDQLLKTYIERLLVYESTAYVWGGENFVGIDCSGLARRAMIEALFLNGEVWGALKLWYFDSSAKAMRDNYRGTTVYVASSLSINKLDHGLIEKGDMAVTADGVHVLMYLGDMKWIEANPTVGKVLVSQVPVSKNPWFETPVKLRRWSFLR